jgi:hypothetical protein
MMVREYEPQHKEVGRDLHLPRQQLRLHYWTEL